jgi:hypothetical protein
MLLPQLVHRMIVDEQFRAALQADPVAAGVAYDLALSAAEWDALLDALRLYTQMSSYGPGGPTKELIWDGGRPVTPAALL